MLSLLERFWPALTLSIAAVAALFLGWRGSRQDRSPRPDPSTLENMRVRDFEALVRESFRQQGYKVVDAVRGATEGGELILRRDRETVLVQCRHWRDRKVGAGIVLALQRAMAQRGAGGGFILTTGRFSREAGVLATTCNIRLIDGPALRDLMSKATGAAALAAGAP